MHRVPVFKAVLGAYAFVWQARKDFVSLALPLVVAVAIVGTLFGWLWPPVFATTPEEFEAAMANRRGGAMLSGLLFAAISVAVVIMFAVAWHRRYLVPDELTTVRAALRWGWRQTRFLLLTIAVGLIAALAYAVSVLVFALIGGLFILVASLIDGFLLSDQGQTVIGGLAFAALVIAAGLLALSIYGRLSMWFPSTAMDHRLSARECWAFSRGNGWRLALIIVLVTIPFLVLMLVVYMPLAFAMLGTGLFSSLTLQFLVSLVQLTISFIGTAAGVSALSIAYRELMAAGRAAPPTAGA